MAPFLVGRRPKFGQRFVDDFKASLYEEPEFPDDDTPEEREVRNMVLDVKKELKAALDRGEDIAQMMNDAQDDLDRLVSYRDTLMRQLKEIKLDDKYSDDDIHDFITAANQMLKSQGLQELSTPNLTYRQFMLQRRRERAQFHPSDSERK
jgi:arsenate reductase-like glutaredoxin family protein